MDLIVLTKEQWLPYSEVAHQLCFNETGFSDIERCDFALLVVEGETPLMYATIRQHDALTAYMSRGGAFPSVKGTPASFQAFELMLDYLKSVNTVISMRVLNTNTPMLKFAMKTGFVIEGIAYHKQQIFLEHFLEVPHVVATSNTGSNSDDGCKPSATAR